MPPHDLRVHFWASVAEAVRHWQELSRVYGQNELSSVGMVSRLVHQQILEPRAVPRASHLDKCLSVLGIHIEQYISDIRSRVV